MGKKIFISAETEKSAHVTYFLHGMRSDRLKNETIEIVQSLKKRDYSQNPKMSAAEITNKVLDSLSSFSHDFYVINFANADMVGHSGDFEATVKACEFLDEQLELLYEEFVVKRDGTMVITADHGNAEEMLEESGEKKPSHTTNNVPFVIVAKNLRNKKIKKRFSAGLSVVTPTILSLLRLRIYRKMDRPLQIVPKRSRFDSE